MVSFARVCIVGFVILCVSAYAWNMFAVSHMRATVNRFYANTQEIAHTLSALPLSFSFEGLPESARAEFVRRAEYVSDVSSVDVWVLDIIYMGLGTHYRDDLLAGFTLFVKGMRENIYDTRAEGRLGFDRWREWYGAQAALMPDE